MSITYKKVSIDKIAHDIAIKARNQHVRETAKLRVQAQNMERDSNSDFLKDQITEARADADAKEALAREWSKKAERALAPINARDVLAIVNKVPPDRREPLRVEGEHWNGAYDRENKRWDLDGQPTAYLIPLYNSAVDLLNVIAEQKELDDAAIADFTADEFDGGENAEGQYRRANGERIGSEVAERPECEGED